jgi:hypothetical protein
MVEENVTGIQFQVTTRLNNATPFDFCVTGLEILVE